LPPNSLHWVAYIAPRRLRGGALTMTRLGAVLVAVLAWVTLSAAQPDSAAAAICLPKDRVIGGQPAVVFCGPAVATIKAVGRTFRITGGNCVTQGGSRFAQIGTLNGPRRGALQSRPLFYILFSRASPSKGSILYWIVDGKRYRAAAGTRITLAGKRITFSGRLDRGAGATGSGPFSGTVACGA